jgi:hypothetical protein
MAAMATPSKPRGYSKAELDWARANQDHDPEARLILVHHADSGKVVPREAAEAA